MTKLGAVLGLTAALFTVVTESSAQLAEPNEMGVRMGHVHLTVADLEASKNFWVDLGGISLKAGSVDLIKLPGVFIILRKAEPTGDSAGSILNHIGFLSRNGADVIPKWKALGTKIELNQRGTGGFFYTPDGLRVEIPERSSISSPLVFDQIHFFPVEPAPDGGSSVAEMQAWYSKFFGAKPGKAGGLPNNYYEEVVLPGVNLRFSKSPKPVLPTKGRAIDHIGFEVSNLESFCKKLEEAGIKLDVPYTRRPDLGVAIAFLSDPWGTSIELTEGLDRK
jgi:catechol 2,3-dioxygenase-like lactoylglutathione lyase family enzyme